MGCGNGVKCREIASHLSSVLEERLITAPDEDSSSNGGIIGRS